MYIDSHSHLAYVSDKTGEDVDDILGRAFEKNVKLLIDIGCDLESCRNSLEISKNYPENVYVAVAIHPNSLNHKDEFKELHILLENNPNIVAIGETGLDNHWHPETIEDQKSLFIKHINLAETFQKPVVIHCREAYEECYEIISKFTNQLFIMHSYAADHNMNNKFTKLNNTYFSISGVVTFKNAPVLHEIVSNLPLDRILLETDCPYLAPEPYRGKTNEPAFIPIIAKKIADLKEIDVTEVEKTTTKTAKELYNLTKIPNS